MPDVASCATVRKASNIPGAMAAAHLGSAVAAAGCRAPLPPALLRCSWAEAVLAALQASCTPVQALSRSAVPYKGRWQSPMDLGCSSICVLTSWCQPQTMCKHVMMGAVHPGQALVWRQALTCTLAASTAGFLAKAASPPPQPASSAPPLYGDTHFSLCTCATPGSHATFCGPQSLRSC